MLVGLRIELLGVHCQTPSLPAASTNPHGSRIMLSKNLSPIFRYILRLDATYTVKSLGFINSSWFCSANLAFYFYHISLLQ
jgi:hypothetical protein